MPPTSGVVVGAWASKVDVISGTSSARRGDRRAGLRLGRGSHLGGGLLDRLDDVHVAGAAAQVAADAPPDLVLARVRVLTEQPGGLHDHPRGAEAALQAVLVPERL